VGAVDPDAFSGGADHHRRHRRCGASWSDRCGDVGTV